MFKIKLLLFLFVLGALLAMLMSCGLSDLSGITKNDKNQWIVVNNRPGAFAVCEDAEGSVNCERMKFNLATHKLLDLEGITFVGDNLYYAVIEKRNNQCLSGCELSQEVVAFRISASGDVYTDSCGSLKIPLFDTDIEDCSFANCGLEGIAYDSDRNRLFIAKEMVQPRIFIAEMNKDKCITGEYREVSPPRVYMSYNGLAYSSKWQSLFLLSSHHKSFYAWNLVRNEIVLRSEDMPTMQKFLDNNDLVEGIYVDDETNQIVLLAEDGSFVSAKLPELKNNNN